MTRQQITEVVKRSLETTLPGFDGDDPIYYDEAAEVVVEALVKNRVLLIG